MPRNIRVPGSLDIPTRFFGHFNAVDILRLSLPVLLVGSQVYPEVSISSAVLLVVGTVTGGVWYWWTPRGQHVDTHLRNGVRWFLNRSSIHGTTIDEKSTDYFITEDGAAVGVISVSPANLEMKSEAEQMALHAANKELFETISYPIAVHSRQRQLDLSGYIDHVEEDGEDLENVREDYVDYCRDLNSGDLTTTQHYVVVRVPPKDSHWLGSRIESLFNLLPIPTPDRFESDDDDAAEALKAELDSRCSEIIDTLNVPDLKPERLSEGSLYDAVEEFQTRQPNPGISWTSQPDNEIGSYRRTAVITEFPSSVELGWPVQLLRTEGQVDVTQVIKPRNAADTSKKLQRLSEKLNAEIESFLRQGYRGTNRLESLLEDVEWMLDLLADREDQPVDYGAYITAHATEQQECERTFDKVRNRLNTMQVEFEEPVLRTDQAYRTDSPLYSDGLDESQMMPARSAAAGFPFATQDTEQDEGVIYGIDRSDEMPILLDRFSWSSHSMARMGMVGSGKSYACKLEILRSVLAYDDLQVYVVDPKKEYKHLIRSLDGERFILSDKLGFDDIPIDELEIAGFEVEKRGQKENVEALVDAVEGLYHATSQNRKKTLVVIDEARILMNDEEGRRVLNQFVLEGRDTNTAITLISQNASHFTHCREGRGILDNMPGKVFMRHDRVPGDVVNYFDLSQREKQELYELKTGTEHSYSEALIKVSGRLDTRIRVEATDREHVLIDTGGTL